MNISLSQDESISVLKQKIYDITNILPSNQKLLGIRTTNGPPCDTTLASEFIGPASKTSFLLMGTPQHEIPDGMVY